VIFIGQYYKFINIDKKEKCEKNRDLLKLTEHSYYGNAYCNDILYLLSNSWKNNRIVHVGDYAEPNDKSTTDKFITGIVKENNLTETVYDWGKTFKEVNPINSNKIRYVFNHDKKEYVDLMEQPIQWFYYDENSNKLKATRFNSFALLVACGNEQGGGDYFSVNKEYIGFWAGDRLESSEHILEEYKDYKKNNLVFHEYYNLKNQITNWDDINMKNILSKEREILIEKLNYIKSKDKTKIRKIKLDKESYNEEEIKPFEKILKDFKKEIEKEQISL